MATIALLRPGRGSRCLSSAIQCGWEQEGGWGGYFLFSLRTPSFLREGNGQPSILASTE